MLVSFLAVRCTGLLDAWLPFTDPAAAASGAAAAAAAVVMAASSAAASALTRRNSSSRGALISITQRGSNSGHGVVSTSPSADAAAGVLDIRRAAAATLLSLAAVTPPARGFFLSLPTADAAPGSPALLVLRRCDAVAAGSAAAGGEAMVAAGLNASRACDVLRGQPSRMYPRRTVAASRVSRCCSRRAMLRVLARASLLVSSAATTCASGRWAQLHASHRARLQTSHLAMAYAPPPIELPQSCWCQQELAPPFGALHHSVLPLPGWW